jgi:hypothetical protein
VVAGPDAFALVFVVAEFSPDAVLSVVEPEAVSAGDLEDSEPGVVFAADVSEPQACADIPAPFDVLPLVSVVVAEVDSSGRPKFPAFPNGDHYTSSSSSDEAAGQESVHRSTGVRTNYGLCSIFSNRGPHQNRNLEHCYNRPSPGYNIVSDTNDLPTGATTSHCRNRVLPVSRGQHRHTSQGSRPPVVARHTQWGAAVEY